MVRVIGSFEKSGVDSQRLSEANPREKKKRFGSNYREVRETGGSRNRDFSTVTALILKLYMNFKKPTLHVQQKPVYSNNGQGIYFSLAASNFNYDVCCISFSRLIRQAIPSRILEC